MDFEKSDLEWDLKLIPQYLSRAVNVFANLVVKFKIYCDNKYNVIDSAGFQLFESLIEKKDFNLSTMKSFSDPKNEIAARGVRAIGSLIERIKPDLRTLIIENFNIDDSIKPFVKRYAVKNLSIKLFPFSKAERGLLANEKSELIKLIDLESIAKFIDKIPINDVTTWANVMKILNEKFKEWCPPFMMDFLLGRANVPSIIRKYDLKNNQSKKQTLTKQEAIKQLPFNQRQIAFKIIVDDKLNIKEKSILMDYLKMTNKRDVVVVGEKPKLSKEMKLFTYEKGLEFDQKFDQNDVLIEGNKLEKFDFNLIRKELIKYIKDKFDELKIQVTGIQEFL
jgi:hypothetical protein